METCTTDLRLYLRSIDKSLQGLHGTYVDDTRETGPSIFEKESESIERAFDSNRRSFDNIQLAGIEGTNSTMDPFYARRTTFPPHENSQGQI